MKLNLVKALAAVLLLFPAVSFGGDLKMLKGGPSEADVDNVRNKADEFLTALVGVNGSAITACETKTGVPFMQLSQQEVAAAEFEFCLMLSTSTKDAESALNTLLPAGTRISGVYVISKYVGVITIQ